MAPRGNKDAREIGSEKERLARLFLEGEGLRLVESNYRCRRGEIDLVMREADTLVFVEVRYRSSLGFGTPAESVDVHKQRRLAAAAAHYLQRHPSGLPCRFDVVAINASSRIEWIRDAFVLS